MNDIQRALMGVFRFSIEFFRENDLRYCSCGGTVLGAVRHQGFIPWDDDIDIYMPRLDYERLISIRNKLEGTGHSIVSAQTHKGYYCPFAKIVKTDSTIWEFKYYPYPLGIFIDIFPLDYYDESDERITKMQKCYSRLFIDYQKALKTYSFSDYLAMLRHGQIFSVCKNAFFHLFYKPRQDYYYRRWLNARGFLSNDETGIKCVCLTQWEGRIFYREWFDDCIEVPFEDMSIKIPMDYNSYLSLLYGDYMKLPPVEKRISDHRPVYLDYGRHLTIEEMTKV